MLDLTLHARCFQGIIPAAIATASQDGTPNISYLSHIQVLDARRVALSCQFFNKTRQNVGENPYAMVGVHDPITFQAYELRLRFDHSETAGALFDEMSERIEAIASHTGLAGVFRLLSADVYDVEDFREVEGHLSEAQLPVELTAPSAGPQGELRSLQHISHRINAASSLDELLTSTLCSMHETLGFEHSMVLLPDESGEKLFTVASHGYGQTGVGAEVRVGDGVLGRVAAQRKLMRLGGMEAALRYSRAARSQVEHLGTQGVQDEIPLPGLPDAQSQLALPLVVRDRLVGILAVESAHPTQFLDWHEAFLGVIGNQIALGIDRMMASAEAQADAIVEPGPETQRRMLALGKRRSFCYYQNDDCVFLDGEYLIRNVPGKILWKILTSHQREGRTDFSNRELRLDASLGLPPIKDNLESRLILLRKRLEQKCPELRLASTRRGHFTLEVDCTLELNERASS
jgi:hypothetical protein